MREKSGQSIKWLRKQVHHRRSQVDVHAAATKVVKAGELTDVGAVPRVQRVHATIRNRLSATVQCVHAMTRDRHEV